jgi:hypothetical protein
MKLLINNSIIGDLNKDQLDGLATLAFDLAKVAFAFMLLPAENPLGNFFLEIVSKMLTAIIGLAFTYLALVFLKLKEIIKK